MRLASDYCFGILLGASIGCFAGTSIGLILSSNRAPADAQPQVQCGHWCVRRVCELLGAPVEIPTIVRMLPPEAHGHSMSQLAKVLNDVGLRTDGRRESYDSFSRGRFPCIAHIESPEPHFVVVAGVGEGLVHVFDGSGRRASRPSGIFQKQWSGNVLWISRQPSIAWLPAFGPPTAPGDPRIQFDSLFVDKGALEAGGATSRFVFPFSNVGDADLQIKGVEPDCKCLTVEKPERMIAPGQRGEIAFVYLIKPRSGPFFHEATVSTNDPLLPEVRVKLAGLSDARVSVTPSAVRMGNVAAGATYKRTCFIRYDGDDEDFRVTGAESHHPAISATVVATADAGALKSLVPDTASRIRPDPRLWAVQICVNPRNGDVGPMKDEVLVRTNKAPFGEIQIAIAGRIVPPVGLFPDVLDLGERDAAGAGLARTVTVASLVGDPLRIRSVICAVPGLESSFSETEWAPAVDIRLALPALEVVPSGGAEILIEVDLRGTDKPLSLSLPLHARGARR
jgi:hypothetical protein